MKRTCWTHDRAKAIEHAAAKGLRCPVLKYHAGDEYQLLPNGTQVRMDRKDRSISGKARRRQELAERREINARIVAVGVERAPAPASIPVEIGEATA